MRQFFSILFISSVLLLVPSARAVQTTGPKNATSPTVPKATEQEARATAERWLSALDQNQYATVWDTLCPGMKKQIGTQQAFESMLEKTRTPVGALETRTFKQVTLARSSDTGEITHATVEFTTSFQTKKQAVEELTVIHHGGNAWKVSKYRIK